MEVVIHAGMLWVVVQHPAASDVQVHADCFSFIFGWKKYIFYVHVSKFPYLTENKETGPSYICLVILSNNFFLSTILFAENLGSVNNFVMTSILITREKIR